MAAAVKLHRHAGRRRAARFLAEGPNLVEAALRRGVVSEVFATESAAERFSDAAGRRPVQLVTERAAKALSDTVTPVGLVAVCAMPEADLDTVLAVGPTLLAVPVGISEPGNAGTLIRVADAMGADAVVLAGPSVDPYNGKCLRASAGSIFTIPVISEPDAVGGVTAIKDAGLQVLATTLDGKVSLDDAELSVPTGVAVRCRGPRPAAGKSRIWPRPSANSDGRQRRKPQCRLGGGDLPLRERPKPPD